MLPSLAEQISLPPSFLWTSPSSYVVPTDPIMMPRPASMAGGCARQHYLFALVEWINTRCNIQMTLQNTSTHDSVACCAFAYVGYWPAASRCAIGVIHSVIVRCAKHRGTVCSLPAQRWEMLSCTPRLNVQGLSITRQTAPSLTTRNGSVLVLLPMQRFSSHLEQFSLPFKGLCLILAIYLVSIIYRRLEYVRAKRVYGCKDTPRYPHKDPIWGLDLFFAQQKAGHEERWLPTSRRLFAENGKTYEVTWLGQRMIHTSLYIFPSFFVAGAIFPGHQSG